MKNTATRPKLLALFAACTLYASYAGAQDDDAAPDTASSPSGIQDDEGFQVYPYLGLAIDNFAASSTRDYLNPEESGDSKSRETFGIAFQYALWRGQRHGDKQVSRFGRISVYGQTTHGVRSTDVDCEANPDNPLCVPFGPEIADAENDPTQRALYILRNASSLEAMLGLRYEFLSLRGGEASVYTTVQAGFVAVEDDDDDVADLNHIALGARIANGKYRDSFVEVARGENDLFIDHPNNRSKINARVVTRPEFLPKFMKGKSLLFAHIVADVDGDEGADSVQTYLGIAFCFGGNTGACEQ